MVLVGRLRLMSEIYTAKKNGEGGVEVAGLENDKFDEFELQQLTAQVLEIDQLIVAQN